MYSNYVMGELAGCFNMFIGKLEDIIQAPGGKF